MSPDRTQSRAGDGAPGTWLESTSAPWNPGPSTTRGRTIRTTPSPGTASGSGFASRPIPQAAILPARPPTGKPSPAAPRSICRSSPPPCCPDKALRRFGLGIGGDISPALSFRIDVAADGSISGVAAMTSIVRVRRCSYGEADRLMDAGAAPGLAALAELADRRRVRRVANGAVEIDIPEARIVVEGGPGERNIGSRPCRGKTRAASCAR